MPEPGISRGLPVNDYFEVPAASYSGLKTLIERSPAHVLGLVRKPTNALTGGTLAHAAVLEPERFQAAYLARPDGLNLTRNHDKAVLLEHLAGVLGAVPAVETHDEHGKPLAPGILLLAQLAAAEAALAAQDITLVSASLHATALACAEACHADPDAGPLLALLAPRDCEVSLFATDPDTGVALKARADGLLVQADLILDLKTAESAAAPAFRRAARKYHYQLQRALYPHVYHCLTGRSAGFLHLVVESAPPFSVAVYDMDARTVADGLALMHQGLTRWAECEATGYWPGYPAGIQTLSLFDNE